MLTSKCISRLLTFTSMLFFISGCFLPQIFTGSDPSTVILNVDGKTQSVTAIPGSKVQQVLLTAGISLNKLDKVSPPLTEMVTEGYTITVIRCREEFYTKNVEIPFEHQTVKNESLNLGETRLLQPGKNGIQEIVTRNYYENEKLVSTSISQSTTMTLASPEIIMIGVQMPFNAVSIPGKLVYLSSGIAWLMQTSTSNRTPLVTTGDLDGRILKLSRDGKWLLFTRKSTLTSDVEINTLWAQNIDEPSAAALDLKTSNIIHFADWDPGTSGTMRVLYSRVEPRAAAPGWQANNDLYRMVVAPNGNLGVREKIIDTNSGGVYGWWGTFYNWSPNGKLLAYSRPDEIGIVSFNNKRLIPLMNIEPYQTHSDWALNPGISWGADSRTIFFVSHAQAHGEPGESPNFDVNAISLDSDLNVRMVQQSGMFAYPVASPLQKNGDQLSYSIAYLQSVLPVQSDTSGYKLIVMDRDGSNKKILFPNAGLPGISPQTTAWAPDSNHQLLALIYLGNLWLIDPTAGTNHQVTDDGTIQKLDWK